ncbi:MAG TPA: hypothetical protein H9805_09120 [Candidatus Janibacter merdipullorum]|nr:hypothetical protein [Candidatus Janibacter merdipullorum]
MKTTTTATAVGAATLLALAGCGSGPSEGDTVSLTDLREDVDAAMKDAGTGSMSAKAGQEKITGDFDLSDAESTSLKGDGGQQSVDVRQIKDDFYLKAPSPEMTQKGKTWIKADPDSKEPATQQLGASLESMTKLKDPFAAIDGAKDVDAEVASVDGDEVTYEIALSKKQMAAVMKAQAKEAGDEQGAAMAEQGAQKTTVELVVDGDDRPVKSTTTAGEQSLTVSYSDWGGDVSIKAPAKDSVGTPEVPEQPAPGGSGSGGSGSSGSGGSGSGSGSGSSGS